MPKLNWKSLSLVSFVAFVAVVILAAGIRSTLHLPLLSWSGLATFFILVALTLLSSRFTVPVTNVDGTTQSNKTVADAFIFLSAMMYTMPPGNSFGPALLLAATVGFIASLSVRSKWSTVFAVS